MLNGLDIFSGIGGLSIALAPWVEPVAYCENDKYAISVLLSRMSNGELALAPIWDDVTTLTRLWPSPVDIIYGGFPCQDISVAGHGKGLDGERSGLVFQLLRLVREIKPSFVFLENVPAIKSRGAERISKELAREGYDLRWDVISAAEVGAPHLRKRWFLLAADTVSFPVWNWAKWMPDGWADTVQAERKAIVMDDGEAPWGKAKPELCRMDDGAPPELERYRALGNAVVPLQARTAFKRLMGL